MIMMFLIESESCTLIAFVHKFIYKASQTDISVYQFIGVTVKEKICHNINK